MQDHLFVYGSLCPDCSGVLGRPQRLSLARESAVVGPATMRGRMIDLGSYPGLVEGPGLVHGILLRLNDPPSSLRWLDLYENAGPAPGSEYRRLIRHVSLADGGEQEAWVYVMNRIPAHGRHLPAGRWPRRAR